MENNNDVDNANFIKIMNLLEDKTDLENKVRVLENKIIDKDELLEYFTSKQGGRSKQKSSPKSEFYKTHKNDEDIIQQLKPFKEAYPTVRIPAVLVRALTDAKYLSSLNK